MDSTKDKLCGYLNDARENAIFKAEGLAEHLARTPLTPTGTHILGVLHHLAINEYEYFGTCLKRKANDRYVREFIAPHDPDADFLPPADMRAQQLIGLYRKAIAFADEAISTLPLDSPVEVPWWGPAGNTTLDHLLIHALAETSRHAGHLDIIREQLDGRAGWTAQLDLLPDYTAGQWAEQREKLQQLADAFAPGS
ncbi:DinB family protein [Glutamicibacter sp. NPDC127525]|uniref:DinB family protein n=1 Tax=unclassified Glutamicibacter TaxID=2627139 RepID=UPI00363805CE